jgi:CheY-like chemotaxis protein
VFIRSLERLEITGVTQAVDGVEALAALRSRAFDLELLDGTTPA